MFRHLSVAVLAIIASASLPSPSLGAQEASDEPRPVELSGAFDLVSARAIGSGRVTIAFVAASGGELGAASEAALEAAMSSVLASLRATARGAEGAGPIVSADGCTVYFMLYDPEPNAPPRDSEPGAPLIREPSLAWALADMEPDAVVLIDLASSGEVSVGGGSTTGPIVRAASLGRMTPRSVLEAVRAAGASGSGLREYPVADFYAAAGLSPGAKSLAPWLEAGLAAVAIEGGPDDIDTVAALAPAIVAAVSGQAEALDSEASIVPGSDDVGYLRYPAPTGPVIVSDAAITLGAVSTMAFVAAALALGLLRGRRRRASLKAAAKEAAASFALSFIALFGAMALARLAAWAVRAAAVASFARGAPSWAAAAALALRAAGALSLYYTASGLASRLGLHGDHRRIDAARASLGLLCLDALAAVLIFPPAAPFLLAAVIVSAIASERAVGAAVGLVAVSLLALPFFDPRAIAAIGSARGAESVAQAMLAAGPRGNAVVAAFAAPFGLWLNAASSPEARLRRGARIAPLWLVAAIACAAGEAVLTAWL